MSTIGSHPGAILFRFSVMIILIAILMVTFLRYFDDSRQEIERRSIVQTKTIINSALSVVFASYAVKGRLNDLNQLDSGNPFVFLEEYQMLPPAYRGEIESDSSAGLNPGWYYSRASGNVIYVPRYLEVPELFAVVLNYDDDNQSGRFESDQDRFNNLQFKKKPRP